MTYAMYEPPLIMVMLGESVARQTGCSLAYAANSIRVDRHIGSAVTLSLLLALVEEAVAYVRAHPENPPPLTFGTSPHELA